MMRIISPPPPELVTRLKLSSFYQKWVDVSGFPVLASEKVAEAAVREAAYLIEHLLAGRDDIRKALIANKVRCAVMGSTERTLDIPEHSDLTPKDYWNRRARGLGATKWRPAVSGAEENLLGYPGDPYAGESILIHEFSHAIHEMGVRTLDPTFDTRLKRSLDRALAQGLWKGTYAATNPAEYWAEGAQSWFDCNAKPNSSHNEIRTREALQKYDPELATLLAEVFRKNEWRYKSALQRLNEPHLRGYDPTKAPRFAW